MAKGQKLLLAIAHHQEKTEVLTPKDGALRRLLRYHILESVNGSYRFEIPLLERWVHDRAVPV